MQANNYSVYRHVSPGNKTYIGITKQSPETRWKRGAGYKDNPYFYKAIQKYGWDNLRHEILFDGLSKEVAEALEVALIAVEKSDQREYGYNIAPGGNTTTPADETRQKQSEATKAVWSNEEYKNRTALAMRGIKRSDSAKANISAAQKKRFLNPEERKKVSDRQKGKVRTESAKIKTSASLKKFYSDPENKIAYKKAHEGVNRKIRAKSVLCVETGEVFEAAVDAEKKFGISHQNIIAVCRGKRPYAGGYCWKYAEIGE